MQKKLLRLRTLHRKSTIIEPPDASEEQKNSIRSFYILNKDPATRKEEDIDFLMDHFTSIPFFNKFKLNNQHEILRKLSKKMELVEFQMGQAIVRYLEPSESFFVIVSGKVNVYIPKNLDKIHKQKQLYSHCKQRMKEITEGNIGEEEGLMTAEEKEQQLANFALGVPYKELIGEMGPLSYEFIEEKEEMWEDGIFKFQFVKQLEEGMEFGELGLVQQKPRTATILSANKSYLIKISKEDYTGILMEEERKKIEKRAHFFSVNFFPDFLKENLVKMMFFISEKQFFYKNSIYKKGDASNEIYFVFEGEVLLYTSQGKQNQLSRCSQNVVIVSKGQLFGEIEFLESSPRKLSAVSTFSPTTLLVLTRNVRNSFEFPIEVAKWESLF